MKQSIGEFLATLRKAHGYTQQEVADRLSVSNRTVSAWERGTVLPDILLLPALAELYGVTADEILAGERKQSADGTQTAELSEKAEAKLLKRKLAKFSAQSYILAGLLALGLLFFFLGLWLEIVTVVWTGFAWWLLLLFAGLIIAAVSLFCLFAFWRSAEVSADEELPFYGAYLILLRRKLALALCVPAAVPFGFFVFSLIILFAGTDRAVPLLLAAALAAVIALLLAGIFLPSAAVKKYGGEEAAPIRSRNRKLYKKCALFCLIPVLAGAFVLALFGLWQPEMRLPVFEAALNDFTAEMETLVCEVYENEPKPLEYAFELSALSKTAVEGVSYDLGNGFTCTFQDEMETCCIKSRYVLDLGFYQSVGDTFFFHRLHAAEGEYSVYNLKYSEYSEGKVSAVDWKGKGIPQELRLEADENRAKLLRCHREDYFPLAAPLALFGMLAGVGVCILVCAIKRERLKVKL